MAHKGIAIASAVAGLFLAGGGCKKKGSDTKVKGTSMVKCEGINSCKGKSECGGTKAGHSCHGKNACKGKGWIKASAADCTKKGGKALGPYKKM